MTNSCVTAASIIADAPLSTYHAPTPFFHYSWTRPKDTWTFSSAKHSWLCLLNSTLVTNWISQFSLSYISILKCYTCVSFIALTNNGKMENWLITIYVDICWLLCVFLSICHGTQLTEMSLRLLTKDVREVCVILNSMGLQMASSIRQAEQPRCLSSQPHSATTSGAPWQVSVLPHGGHPCQIF